jgi:hypothetical protein
MNKFKLLALEDDEQDMATCRMSIRRYQAQKGCEIELMECSSLEQALTVLDNSFDGAIVDLKINGLSESGNEVAKKIIERNLRIPIAIFTGTPDAADSHFNYLGLFKKGEVTYEEILDVFMGIHNTGLTRIMGGRGILEKTLGDVFQNNILPRRNSWVAYGKESSEKTERALLRHTLSCLLQLLDDDDDECFAEEFYIYPPISPNIRTGSLVKKRDGGARYVVLNPACDLVVRRSGSFKTDRVLVGEIDGQETLQTVAKIQNSKLKKALEKLEQCEHHHPESKAYINAVENGARNLEKIVGDALRNSQSLYQHWLPTTDYFEGGFLNFRKLSTFSKEQFDKDFSSPDIQISPSFVKDIISRFASFYARQGQPDIQHANIVTELLRSVQKAT